MKIKLLALLHILLNSKRFIIANPYGWESSLQTYRQAVKMNKRFYSKIYFVK